MLVQVASKWEKVERWLKQTDDSQWVKIQATGDSNGIPVTPANILELTLKCEWAEIEDMSELLYNQQGIMFPHGLEIGWGDPSKAYREGNSSEAGVYFFNAYKRESVETNPS